MKHLGPLLAAAGFLPGVAIWKASPVITGEVEPWDAKRACYPLELFLSGVIASLAAPRWFWVDVRVPRVDGKEVRLE